MAVTRQICSVAELFSLSAHKLLFDSHFESGGRECGKRVRGAREDRSEEREKETGRAKREEREERV